MLKCSISIERKNSFQRINLIYYYDEYFFNTIQYLVIIFNIYHLLNVPIGKIWN